MPKLKNITVEQIAAIDGDAESLIHRFHELNERMEQGYVDEVENPEPLARSLLALSQAAGRAAQLMLSKAYLRQQRRELEAEFRQRAK